MVVNLTAARFKSLVLSILIRIGITLELTISESVSQFETLPGLMTRFWL